VTFSWLQTLEQFAHIPVLRAAQVHGAMGGLDKSPFHPWEVAVCVSWFLNGILKTKGEFGLPHCDAFRNLAAEYGVVAKPSCTTWYVSFDLTITLTPATKASGVQQASG